MQAHLTLLESTIYVMLATKALATKFSLSLSVFFFFLCVCVLQ